MSNMVTEAGTHSGFKGIGALRPFGFLRRQRQRFLVDRRLQLRMAAELVIFLVVLAVPAMVTLYVLTELILLQRVDVTELSAIDAADVALVWGYVLSILIALAVIVVCLSVLLSHRIAGPAVKLEGHLRRMATGDLRGWVRLRKSDELKGLAEAVNRASDEWSELVRESRREVQRLKERPRRFKPADLDAHIAALDALLARYEVSES